MYHYLEKNKDKITSGNNPYLFYDALNCAAGCLYGTGIEPMKGATDDALTIIAAIRTRNKKSGRGSEWARNLTPAQRLKKQNPLQPSCLIFITR